MKEANDAALRSYSFTDAALRNGEVVRAMGMVEALLSLRKAGYSVVVVLVRFGMRDTFPAELAAMGFQVHEIRSEEQATLFSQQRIAV